MCWWVTATPLARLLLDGLQVQDRTASSVQVTFAGASSSSSASCAIPHVRLGDVLPEICITLKDSSHQVLRRTETHRPTVLAPTAETELLGQCQLLCYVELLAEIEGHVQHMLPTAPFSIGSAESNNEQPDVDELKIWHEQLF
jgi:hypothetical protein